MNLLGESTVDLIDSMGDDLRILAAARVSTGAQASKGEEKDRKLLKYLWEHGHCYHPENQVLTKSGWKMWKDCSSSEIFLVPDPKTRTLIPEVLNVLEFENTDIEMFCFKNNRMSYSVTGNHRMWFKKRNSSAFNIYKASDMSKWGHFDPVCGYRLVPENESKDPFFMLVGFFLGDGSHASKNTIIFHLKKGRKKLYLRKVLTAIGWRYRERKSSTHEDAIVFSVTVPSSFWDVVPELTRAKTKRLKNGVLNTLTTSELNGLFDGLINSDGSQKKDRKQIQYSSFSKDLGDVFQAVSIMCGMDAHFVTDKTMSNAYRPGRVSLESRPQYHSITTYSGKTFCATSSTGLLCIRGSDTDFGFVCGNSSPFEQVLFTFKIRCPIFIQRQMIRHRTARCLSGDALLSFDLPGGIGRRGNQKYSISVSEFHRKWTEGAKPFTGRWGNSIVMPMKKSLSKMKIRTSDDMESVSWSNVTDIWRSGTKKVLKVSFSDGTELKATEDHPCFTDEGILPLMEAVNRGASFFGVGKKYGITSFDVPLTEEEIGIEEWRLIKGFDHYEVSSMGRVRSWVDTGLNKRKEPVIKKQTMGNNGYYVVSISKGGKSYVKPVHNLVINAFKPHSFTDTRHLDGNRANSRLSNLEGGTRKQNAQDRVAFGASHKLCVIKKKATSFEDLGMQEVFDLTVSCNNHAFFADDTLVHNCNEESGRYKELRQDFFMPSVWRKQNTEGNKQGSNGAIEHQKVASRIAESLYANAEFDYQKLLALGVAKEQARMVLPVGIFTEFYWNIDLHNLLKFLSKRIAHDAQPEIQEIARKMVELITPIVPWTMEIWSEKK